MPNVEPLKLNELKNDDLKRCSGELSSQDITTIKQFAKLFKELPGDLTSTTPIKEKEKLKELISKFGRDFSSERNMSKVWGILGRAKLAAQKLPSGSSPRQRIVPILTTLEAAASKLIELYH